MSLIRFQKPLRAGVLCGHCNGEIEAISEQTGSVGIAGLRDYQWRHVKDGAHTCTQTFVARPYDAWAATRALEPSR